MADVTNQRGERERIDFSKIKTTIQIPNLIDVQKKSYQRFLQMDLLPNEREDSGFPYKTSGAFRSSILWTIRSATGNASAGT
jgi:DNA-directed RNA polymerase beta subunit